MPPPDPEPSLPPEVFASTHWTVVLAAAAADAPAAEAAMERLCAVYWYPLYAFLRRKGLDEGAAVVVAAAVAAGAGAVAVADDVGRSELRIHGPRVTARACGSAPFRICAPRMPGDREPVVAPLKRYAQSARLVLRFQTPSQLPLSAILAQAHDDA